MENNINFDCCIPCFGKAIVDAKDIYTEYLLNALTPLIFEGLNDLFLQAQKYDKNALEKEKKDSNFKNPGINLFFQHLLSLFKDMNNINLEDETNRIKNASGCAEIFDDLIKAVIKSHILVLTCTSKESKLINETKFHENININTFIHKCYIESIKFIHEMPELFIQMYHDKNNKQQQTIYFYIKLGIKNAIKQVLPMRQILEEFLNNNYEEIYISHMEKIKKMLLESKQNTENNTNLLESNDEIKNKSDKDTYDFDLEDFLVTKKTNNINKNNHEIKLETKSEINSDKNLENKVENKVENKSGIKSEIKVENKSGIKSEIKVENKTGIKSENKVEIVKENTKKHNTTFEDLFKTPSSKKMTDNIMLDAIQKLNKKKELISQNNDNNINNDKNDKNEINSKIDIDIDRKIKESDNHFYESN
jgi:hypothetical protein